MTELHHHAHNSLSHLGDQFVGGMARGAGWSISSRIIHALPFGAVVVLAVLGVGWYVLKRR